MKLVVVSNKFLIYLDYWKLIAKNNPLIEFVFINDNPEIEIKNNSDFKNILVFNNLKNIGKIKSVLNYILSNKISDWIIVFDDKDIFINKNLNDLLNIKLNKDNIFIFDNLSANNKIIGNIFIDGDSLEDFYIKKGNLGDKIILFNSQRILDNKKLYNFFLNFNCHIFETALYFSYFKVSAKSLKPIIIHKYNENGISKNNLQNKLKNYDYYFWETKFYLSKNPCLKVLISKLFVLWILRKKGKIKLIFFHKLLFFFLKFSLLFYLIKKIYLKKLNSLIN